MPSAVHPVAKAFGLPAAEATLPRLLAPLLVWGERSLYGSHGYEGTDVTSVAVRHGADKLELSAALAKVNAICTPCSAKFAAAKLAEMRALTAHRASDGVDGDAMATAYTSRLQWYPSDVVAAACDSWADANTFWPSWAELKDRCEKRMQGRLRIKAALEKALA